MSADLPAFVRLSNALVGPERLPEDLARVHFDRARGRFQDRLGALLTRFDDLVKGGKDSAIVLREDIFPNAELGAMAKAILLLWYVGGFQNASGDWEFGGAAQYYRALVWDAIGAHPPTLSTGYYGHWKYPAER